MPISIPFTPSFYKKNSNNDSGRSPRMANGMQQAFNGNGNGSGSPSPYIKNEPQDEGRFQQHSFGNPDYNSHFHQNGAFDPNLDHGEGIDPSELTMSPVQQNGFPQHFSGSYPGNQGMSYLQGGGGVDDEDLLALGDLNQRHNGNGNYDGEHGMHGQDTMDNLFGDFVQERANGGPMSAHSVDQYSHTPDNAPQSPFLRSFPQQQFNAFNGHGATPSSYNASPTVGSDSTQHSFFEQSMSKQRKDQRPSMTRAGSRKSPVSAMSTPRTPGLGGLQIGTSPGTQPIQTAHLGHRHHKSLSGQWDGTPGSTGSYLDSPLSSPGVPPVHQGISEVFKSGKHASLPAKVENSMGAGPAYQTQEAKRRRRRESHNMVERRRRDNINERIQELSHLVPHHRLEDEKVRKHLINNGCVSPTVGAAGSPPRATSMLAGGVGRRASGVPTTGLTGDEKDKGPNKGDILNGAVGWTRDLMWAYHLKLEQEKTVRELIASLGGTYPFEESEDDKRMRSELYSAIEKNGAPNFHYSRTPGSNLRVPGYTDYAGQPVVPGQESARDSPASKGTPGSSRGTPQHSGQPFWSDEVALKEEDEFNMDMS